MISTILAGEYNFDGLVGPTHNYAGLAIGNLASINHGNQASSPKAAALQGLAKMKELHDLGIPQAVLPPHPRPDLNFLKNLGFSGSPESILKQAYQLAPRLFAASYSASAMWAANAATITPSADSLNKKLYITPANLATNIHRTIEANFNYKILKKIFNNNKYFTVAEPLISSSVLGDEGAANHTRFCTDYLDPGIGLFVYGQEYFNKNQKKPKKYPARQTLEASVAIARQHQLDFDKLLFFQQSPEAIDHGVFHNDVCAVGNKNLLLCHEYAYVNQKNNLNKLKNICEKNNIDLKIHEILHKDLNFQDMVQSYLFNSQLISVPDLGSYSELKCKILLLAPQECLENKSANLVIQKLLDNNIINKVIYVDCLQSMSNGGGPACLRLRVVLTEQEVQAIKQECNVMLTDDLYTALVAWVNKYYRDKLILTDLLDPELLLTSNMALEELASLLRLGDIYQ